MGRVIVVGSVNVDLVVRATTLPTPGTTVTGEDLARHHGGKGGNQAVAAARLGAEVAFVGAVGRDDLGEQAVRALAAEGVSTEHLARVDRPTGVALIVVDAAGHNQIAVAPGANGALDAEGVAAALERLAVGPTDVVLTSREIPDQAVRAALAAARAVGATTILNPAPATQLTEQTYRLADYLTPNEHELTEMTGLADPTAAAASLLEAGGTRWLAVTLGADGAMLRGPDDFVARLPAPTVRPVDTTGAGDTFNGALAALLAMGQEPAQAVRLAVVAASLSTRHQGARDGMPSMAQVFEAAAG
jgi:ribokinase